MGKQRRDFFLNGREAGVGEEVQFPPGWQWRSSFESNPELVRELVEAWRSSAAFRESLVGEVRNAAWLVRNRRMAEGWKFDESLRLIVETFHLMRLAGVPEVEAFAFVGCMGHGCVCDGCDLVDGRRWSRSPSSG